MAEDPPRPISLDDLDRLGINDRRELFWDGKKIEVKSRLNLTRPQTVLAVLVSLAAICGGFASALDNGTQFTCREWHIFCGPISAARTAS